MKITAITAALAATVAASGAVGIIGAPIAFAETWPPRQSDPQGKLINGDVVQAWTISDLKPSTDVIPHQLNGTLWEATATDRSHPGFCASDRFEPQRPYPERPDIPGLFGVATAAGRQPGDPRRRARRPPERCTSTSPVTSPTASCTTPAAEDLLVWVQPPPSAPRPDRHPVDAVPRSPAAPARRRPTTTTPTPAPAAAESTATPTRRPPPPANACRQRAARAHRCPPAARAHRCPWAARARRWRLAARSPPPVNGRRRAAAGERRTGACSVGKPAPQEAVPAPEGSATAHRSRRHRRRPVAPTTTTEAGTRP